MSPTLTTPPAASRSPTHAASGGARTPHTGAPAQGGHLPFAQLLQGAVDDEATPMPAPADAADAQGATAEDAENASPERAESRHPAARDATDDANPTPPQPPVDVPATALDASLHRTGLLAAARAKAAAGADAAGRRHGTALESLADGRDDKAAGLAALAGRDALAAGASNQDLSGLQATLGAMPAQMATSGAGPDAAAAAADFSLSSLGPTSQAVSTPAAPAEAPPAQATLAPAPGSAAFPAALGAQLNTWLQDGVEYATLELNPQDMGPIDVRIALRDGRTDIQLGADVAATRQALAEALPALAEALGDVGLSLAGGSVSDQTGQHAREGDAQGQRAFALPAWLAPGREGADAVASTPRPAQRGLIDLVA
jgi:flagellar hook-length control protein FliK